jgi:hypothetical protein
MQANLALQIGRQEFYRWIMRLDSSTLLPQPIAQFYGSRPAQSVRTRFVSQSPYGNAPFPEIA